ncbi:hypothetical protein CGRA01v4_11237 [Colletotrichum graminicola]|nr:hypothetical protein CGRA01v4_11237 [Colletotrichum graminicola]
MAPHGIGIGNLMATMDHGSLLQLLRNHLSQAIVIASLFRLSIIIRPSLSLRSPLADSLCTACNQSPPP